MPFVNVKVLKGVFSSTQKKQLIKGLTEAIVKVEGEALREFVWVVVEEVKSGDWAIGGKRLTSAQVKAIVIGSKSKKGKNAKKNKVV